MGSLLGGRFHGHAPLVARRQYTPSAPNKTRSAIYGQRPQPRLPQAFRSSRGFLSSMPVLLNMQPLPRVRARDLCKSRPSAEKGFAVRHKPTDSGTSDTRQHRVGRLGIYASDGGSKQRRRSRLKTKPPRDDSTNEPGQQGQREVDCVSRTLNESHHTTTTLLYVCTYTVVFRSCL